MTCMCVCKYLCDLHVFMNSYSINNNHHDNHNTDNNNHNNTTTSNNNTNHNNHNTHNKQDICIYIYIYACIII